MSIQSKVIGIGKYLPPRLVSNKELESVLNTTDEWILSHSGIQQRYWADGNMSTSEMAYYASINAIDNANIKKNEIDMILLATVTPDHELPGTACFLQERLDLANIPAIDVRQQCSGFIFGLSQADLYIKSGQYKTILLVCAELQSKCLDLSERGRNMSILFADGAAAVILQSTSAKNLDTSSQIISTSIHSDGKYARNLWCQAPGTGFDNHRIIDAAMLDTGLQYPTMNGHAIYSDAIQTMSKTLVECMNKSQYTLDDLDYIFFHQANLRISQSIQKKLNLSEKVLYNTIQYYGNTTSATIPLGLAHAVTANKLKPGMLIATVAFGSGYTWGSALIRW